MRFIKLVFIAVFIVFIYFLWTDDTPQRPEPAKPPPTKEEIASRERAAAVSVFGSALKTQLREPKSVQWIKILSDKDGTLICFQYKARNGFGGMGFENTAVLSGRVVDWNKNCVGQKLYDVTYAKRGID